MLVKADAFSYVRGGKVGQAFGEGDVLMLDADRIKKRSLFIS